MAQGVPVGYALLPNASDLDLLEPLIREDPDYYEVCPETLWRVDAAGEFVPNGFHARFTDLRARTGRPFVAHGVGLSVGTLARGDEPRLQRWLARIRADHAAFGFQWYTDHLGAGVLGGDALVLPMPLPMTRAAAAACRERLAALQAVVPDVGLENSVLYHHFGSPLDEPAFLMDILGAPGMHLLLDLHNAWTVAQNAGFDPTEYLERLDLSKVIEIHVSGGGWSDPAWLRSGAVLRLDSHDSAVPEEVWRLLEAWAPRCPNLCGITLERMEGTIEAPDVDLLREELKRIRSIARRLRPAPRNSGSARTAAPPPGRREPSREDCERFEELQAAAFRVRDPLAHLRTHAGELAEGLRGTLDHVDPDGIAMSALIADRLRFERLVQTSREALEWFDRDPADFTAAFRSYRDEVAPSALHAWDEARLFQRWSSGRPAAGAAAPARGER